MIVDLYNKAKNEPTYNKLVGSDYMIVEYKCPIETREFQLLTELHFIIYIISGKKDWITSGKIIECKKGDALFVRKGVYTTRQYFEEDNCILLFFMNDDFIRNFILENQSLGAPESKEVVSDEIFKIDVNDTLESLFHSVFNYIKMGTEIPRNLVELKFKELLFNVVQNSKNTKLCEFFTLLSQTNKTNLDYVMRKNFQHDLQLEEFARLSRRSLSAFKRDFKNYYHQPPGKWLMEKRLEYAKSLLLGSDLNINEICYESGFKNATHFSKVFKDKYQLPPKQFQAESKITEGQHR